MILFWADVLLPFYSSKSLKKKKKLPLESINHVNWVTLFPNDMPSCEQAECTVYWGRERDESYTKRWRKGQTCSSLKPWCLWLRALVLLMRSAREPADWPVHSWSSATGRWVIYIAPAFQGGKDKTSACVAIIMLSFHTSILSIPKWEMVEKRDRSSVICGSRTWWRDEWMAGCKEGRNQKDPLLFFTETRQTKRSLIRTHSW